MKDFVTEKEAATKKCYQNIDPVAVADHGNTHPLGITDPTNMHTVTTGWVGQSKCVASNCMAWRWSHQDTGPSSEPTGFCGLAGLPKYN